MSDKGLVGTETNATSDSVPSSPRKQSKSKRHCARFWWIYVIMFIIVVLVVVLPIIFVGFPKISQDGVNDSTIQIVSMSATEPTADSVYLVQDFIIHSDSKFHPHLDTFPADTGLAGDDAYGVVQLPATDSGSSVPGNLTQTLNITNLDAFSRYNRALLGSENLTMFLKGSTDLHEGSLPTTHVTYDKTFTVKGFNKLDGFNITEFKLISTSQPDGANSNGTVYIPNVSDITVAMGNVTFNNYVDDVYIGNTTINDLTLKPGNNTLPMRSHVETLAILGFIGPGKKYSDGKIPITVTGNSSIYDGIHLTYYEYALKGSNLSVTLDVIAALGGGS